MLKRLKMMTILTALLIYVEQTGHAIDKPLASPKVSHEKIGSQIVDGHDLTDYVLITENFPEGKSFTLYQESLINPKTKIMKYTADERGKLFDSRRIFLEEGHVTMHNMAYGEGVTFSLVSEDGKETYETIIYQHPVEANSDSGAKLIAIMMSPKADLYMFKGEGFCPNETFTLRSVSGKEILQWQHQANAEGTFAFTYSPAVEGKKNGDCSLEFKRENETLAVEFPWGVGRRQSKKNF